MNEQERNLLDRVLLAKEVIRDNSQINPENYIRQEDNQANEIKPIPLPRLVYTPIDGKITEKE